MKKKHIELIIRELNFNDIKMAKSSKELSLDKMPRTTDRIRHELCEFCGYTEPAKMDKAILTTIRSVYAVLKGNKLNKTGELVRLIMENERFCVNLAYDLLKNREINPTGEFDSSGRWYARKGDLINVRTPSINFPYSEMNACRSKKYVSAVWAQLEEKDLYNLLKEI